MRAATGWPPHARQDFSNHRELTTTLVFPPFASVISTGVFVFHEPEVKSGISIDFERLATDCSLNGAMALHAAASYTSMSSGMPLRKQSINLQSIRKSIPP